MNARDIPNIISVLRIVLVVPIIVLMLEQQFAAALLLFFVAGLSDGLDGYLAKRNNWGSRLGSILDPLADKLLLISSYVALGWLGLIPVWLVAVVLIRDIVIVSGALKRQNRTYQHRIKRCSPDDPSQSSSGKMAIFVSGLFRRSHSHGKRSTRMYRRHCFR